MMKGESKSGLPVEKNLNLLRTLTRAEHTRIFFFLEDVWQVSAGSNCSTGSGVCAETLLQVQQTYT